MHGAKQRVDVFVIESVYVEVNVYNIINYLCSSWNQGCSIQDL